LTAKLHLVELPVYLLFLWWSIDAFGIVGAAMAWTARVFVDSGALLYLTGKSLPQAWGEIRTLAKRNLLLLLALGGGLLVQGIALKVFYVAFCLICFSFSARHIVTLETRSFLEKDSYNKTEN